MLTLVYLVVPLALNASHHLGKVRTYWIVPFTSAVKDMRISQTVVAFLIVATG